MMDRSCTRGRPATCLAGLRAAGSGGVGVRLVWLVMIGLFLAQSAKIARADAPAATLPPAPTPRPDSADLDGFYIALGPLVSAVWRDRAWEGGFGAELTFAHVRERRPVSAIGLGVGGLRYAQPGLESNTGRLWADLHLGTRLFGRVVGVTGGVAADVDDVIPPRWGGQAAVWLFVGVIPYVRIGSVQKNGCFIDFGIKVALPVIRI